MGKKVSVIVPIYNSARYLRECLDCIVNQTFRDMEIILVDDCSADNSCEICEEYIKNDSRIKLIKKEKNSGAVESRNIGIETAESEYITFFDSDDFMELDTVEKMYNQAVSTGADIVVCNSQEYLQKKGIFQKNRNVLNTSVLNGKTVFSPSEVSDKIFQFCLGWPWDKMFKRDFIQKEGIRFQTIKHSEDLSFVYGLMACADKISYVNQVCIFHRKHSESVESTRDVAPECFYWALMDLIRILEERNLYELYKKSLLNLSLEFSLWQIYTIKKKRTMQGLFKKLLERLDYFNCDESDIYEYSYQTGVKRVLHPILANTKRTIFLIKNIL